LGAQPVGLVLDPGGARLQRSGTETLLSAQAGDLLHAGDLLRGNAEFAYCPTREILKAQGEVRFTARTVTGAIASRRAAMNCVLPLLPEREAGQLHLSIAMTRAMGGEAELAVEPKVEKGTGPLLDRIAQAEQLASTDAARAAALYRGIRADYANAAWISTRLFVLEDPPARRQPEPAKPADITSEGRVFAIVAGVSKYQNGDIRPLRYAHEDARLFAEYLRSGRAGVTPDERITLLTDEQATTAGLRAAFASTAAQATAKDTVIVLLAMHGTVVEAGKSRGAYLVTHDSDPENLAATALPMGEVQRYLREDLGKAGRVLAFIDACRSGAVGAIPPASQLKVNRALDALTMTDGELLLYAASRPGEVSFEGPQYGGGHGAFTFFVLDAINGAADFDGDGRVDVKELLNFVSQKVPEATNDRQHPREGGTLANSVRLSDLSKPGVAVGTYDPARQTAASQGGTRSLDRVRVLALRAPVDLNEALAAGRVLPDAPQSAFTALRQLKLSRRMKPAEYLDQENRLRVQLEEKGQQVLVEYLKGEQRPVARQEFEWGAKVFESARLLTPESVWLEARAEFAQGRLAIFDKDYAKAIGHLERAVRLDPADACSYNALGLAYLEQARFEEASRAFQDATARAPLWAYARHNLALAKLELGDAQGALVAYKDARKLAPKYAYLAYQEGFVHQQINRRKEAEASYREALTLDPAMAAAHNAIGLLRAEAGDRKAAEAAYREALRVDPKFREAKHNLGLLFAGRPDSRAEAERLWGEILAESPEFTASRLSLARVLAEQQRYVEAIFQYEAVLREKPELAAAREALEQCRRAESRASKSGSGK
jgi:tetratricopeptide (TPR) repeat protein